MAEENDSTLDDGQAEYYKLPPHVQRTKALADANAAMKGLASRRLEPAREIDEAKENLRRFALQLRNLTLPTSPVSLDLAAMVATSLEKFLNDETPSMDAAFGLTPKMGAPGYPKRNRQTARRIWELRFGSEKHKALGSTRRSAKVPEKPASFAKISKQLQREGWQITDESTLKKIWKEHQVEVMSEVISKAWNEPD